MHAVVGTGIKIDRRIVHGDDVTKGVAVVQQGALWLRTQIELSNAQLTAVERDGVGADGITRRAKGAQLQRSFIHDPAIAVAIACAARRIALVVRDDKRVGPEFGNATGC